MHKKINSYLLILAIGFAAFVLSGKQYEQVAHAAPASSYDLLNSLPTSDFIVYVDAQRMTTDIIPAILADKPEARVKLEAELDKVLKHTGFDPRLTDGVAVGLNFNSQRATDASFTVIIRGRFEANTIIENGVAAAVTESRGELVKQTLPYEGKTIYVLARASRGGGSQVVKPDPTSETSSRTMSFVALDSNTVVVGNIKSVQATIDASLGRGRVDPALVQLATNSPNAAASFSGKLTPELARSMRIKVAQADDNIAAIKQVFGSFNANGNDADIVVNLRMETADDARQLSSTLNGLKFMAKMVSSRDSDEGRVIQKLVNALEIYQVGNDVQVNSKVSLKDLSTFVPFH